MKTKWKKLKIISVFTFTVLFYQNFSFTESLQVNLQPLNEKARAHHARELLGSAYQGSAAHRLEGSRALGFLIQNDIYRRLPQKFKKSAIDLSATLLQESERYHVDPVFVMAVIRTESSFNPLARGRHGEIGLMQLKPKTAKWIAEKYDLPWWGPKTLENPAMNVRIGMAYMNYLRKRFNGDANKYISAYNMGYAKVSQMYEMDIKPQIYSSKVMKHYNEVYRRLAASTVTTLLAGN